MPWMRGDFQLNPIVTPEISSPAILNLQRMLQDHNHVAGRNSGESCSLRPKICCRAHPSSRGIQCRHHHEAGEDESMGPMRFTFIPIIASRSAFV
jgi:hypothetical protein